MYFCLFIYLFIFIYLFAIYKTEVCSSLLTITPLETPRRYDISKKGELTSDRHKYSLCTAACVYANLQVYQPV